MSLLNKTKTYFSYLGRISKQIATKIFQALSLKFPIFRGMSLLKLAAINTRLRTKNSIL